jgi:Bacterial regulatory helix-turn-helix protein, lysR family
MCDCWRLVHWAPHAIDCLERAALTVLRPILLSYFAQGFSYGVLYSKSADGYLEAPGFHKVPYWHTTTFVQTIVIDSISTGHEINEVSGVDNSLRSSMAMSDSLTFRLLIYIKAVSETLNFTRAAQRLYLSQPSLSQQIRDLEDQLKFPIFERAGPGIRITDAGRLLFVQNGLFSRNSSTESVISFAVKELGTTRLHWPVASPLPSFRVARTSIPRWDCPDMP